MINSFLYLFNYTYISCFLLENLNAPVSLAMDVVNKTTIPNARHMKSLDGAFISVYKSWKFLVGGWSLGLVMSQMTTTIHRPLQFVHFLCGKMAKHSSIAVTVLFPSLHQQQNTSDLSIYTICTWNLSNFNDSHTPIYWECLKMVFFFLLTT